MANRRPNIWSYVSFSSPMSRPKSHGTLPTHNDKHGDVFEKPNRHLSGSSSPSFVASTLSSRAGKPAWKTPGSRSRYIKLLATFLFILGAVYVLLPRDGTRRSAAIGVEPLMSLDKDLDPMAVTSRCNTPYDSSKPLIQYTLMVDAGSTGSRIHVYRFNNCASTPELENEFFKQTEPREGGSGLSSYGADADGAAKSLDVLLDEAMWNVPESFRTCSPIAVKATAGLRMLGPEKSDRILQAVRHRLETVYPFPVLSEEKGGVEVMDGRDEGVYAWITTNYLLRNIGGPDKNPTAAVFDLGGGSTQIVFEPTFPDTADDGTPDQLQKGDHRYDLKFGGREFSLYQHSYLGYGLMAARENLHQLVLLGEHVKSPTDSSWLSKSLENPCLNPGSSKMVDVEMPPNHPLGATVKINMSGPAVGDHQQCLDLIQKTFKKDAECPLTPCAFNGVHQPSLAKTFAQEHIYLFSYFYDRMEPLGMSGTFTLSELKDVTTKVCEGEKGWKHFEAINGAVDELKDRPEYCLDLNFMLALLVTGYEMPMDRQVTIAKKIDGNELGWCLGASLPLLNQDSGWTCKVKKVS